MKNLFTKTALLGALFALGCTASAADASPWKSLFNGKDLAGWSTYVSMQPTTEGMKTPTPCSPARTGRPAGRFW